MKKINFCLSPEQEQILLKLLKKANMPRDYSKAIELLIWRHGIKK